MVSKFEAFAIAISIGAMALALWLIRIETTTDTLAEQMADDQVGAVYVGESDNQRAAVADALIEAVSPAGDIERLVIDDIIIGNGEEVQEGDTVSVHYIGTLQNGQQFDNSYQRGQPFTLTIGEGRVIDGWEQGLMGMKAGGQRILVIPPALGYGTDGYGPIPGNATLVFAIELLSINE